MERKLSQMEKIIFTICLTLGLNLKAQCIVEINTNNYKLEKLNYGHKRLIIENSNTDIKDCNIFKEKITFGIEEINYRVKKINYMNYYTLQDFLSCKVSRECFFSYEGIFKIKNKYYKIIESISEPDLAPPIPK